MGIKWLCGLAVSGAVVVAACTPGEHLSTRSPTPDYESTVPPSPAPSPMATIAGISAVTRTPSPTHKPAQLPTLLPTSATSQTLPVTSTPSPMPTASGDGSYIRRTPFVPLDNPRVLSQQAATYLGEDELVLGLERQGEARAYPIRMLRFHHIVNDTIAGRPVLITY